MNDEMVRVNLSGYCGSCGYGGKIGMAIYKYYEVWQGLVADADMSPHSGGEHRLVVKDTKENVLAFIDVVEEAVGKHLETCIARALAEHTDGRSAHRPARMAMVWREAGLHTTNALMDRVMWTTMAAEFEWDLDRLVSEEAVRAYVDNAFRLPDCRQ